MNITNPSLSLSPSLSSMFTRVRTVLLAALLGLGSQMACAQNSIESVNVSPQSGGKVVIRVALKEALAGDFRPAREYRHWINRRTLMKQFKMQMNARGLASFPHGANHIARLNLLPFASGDFV